MLTQAERDLLEFEQKHPRMSAKKAALIRTTFGEHPISYYARLIDVTFVPDASVAYPEVVANRRALIGWGAGDSINGPRFA